MLSRIKAFFADIEAPTNDAGRPHQADELQLAAAALLVEAARMDDSFDAREMAKVKELLRARFGLEEDEAEGLLEAAESQVAESHQLFAFTRVVNARFSYEERIELMEMLWQVAYADGQLHDYEANLMRRVAGLIHVSDRDSGDARKRALDQLGGEG